jgi:PAS domain S-box-containing protein
MKIGQRLLLGFAAIIVINVIAGAVVFQSMQSVQSYYNEKKDMATLIDQMKDARLAEKEFRSVYDTKLAVEFQFEYKNVTRDISVLESDGIAGDAIDLAALRGSAKEYHNLVLSNTENSSNIENLWRSEQDLISSPGGLQDISGSMKDRAIELGRKNNDTSTGMRYLYDIQEDQDNFVITHNKALLGDVAMLTNETLAWSGNDPEMANYVWRYNSNLEVLSNLYDRHAVTEDRIDVVVQGMDDDLTALDGWLSAKLDETLKITAAAVVAMIVLSIVTSIGVSIAATRSIARPIESLARTSEEVAAGDLKKKVETSGNDEVASLGRSMQKMISALRDRMEFNDALIRNIMDFQVIISDDGRIIYVNGPALRITGYSFGEISGRDYGKFLPGLPDPHQVQSDMAGICAILRKDGSILQSTCRMSAVKNADGLRIGTMVMVKDTSNGA